jgi:hypothetical protein
MLCIHCLIVRTDVVIATADMPLAFMFRRQKRSATKLVKLHKSEIIHLCGLSKKKLNHLFKTVIDKLTTL